MNRTQRVLEVALPAGVLRPRDLDPYGIPRVYLNRLCERGYLQRVGRGRYLLPDADVSEHHTLAEACKRVPHSVVCLLSALRFHGLTTQSPTEVWLAIGSRAWRPQVDYPALRFVRFSERTLQAGVEEHTIEGVSVRVFSPAKTVADCFKCRNKIGLDAALEALCDCYRQRACTSDELWHHATICRVATVMRPYMEAVV
jgi:predicted transcriptional regulator of viral defense system